jgi:hypothetical protein
MLEHIYESMKATDYDFLLLENVDNFNWNRFWEVFSVCQQALHPVYESFERIDQNETTDLYEVIATNGMKFKLSISFMSKTSVLPQILNSRFHNLDNQEFNQTLRAAYDRTNQPIMSVSFQDEQGEIRTTNKLGNYAFSVIQGIKDAIVLSLHDRGHELPDILFFHILKTEDRKLKFFINVFEEKFPNFCHCFVDCNSNKTFDVVYFHS